jgi:hypothetical protein
MIAAADGKTIYILTTYSLELITTIQSPSTYVSKMCFNANDTVLVFIS